MVSLKTRIVFLICVFQVSWTFFLKEAFEVNDITNYFLINFQIHFIFKSYLLKCIYMTLNIQCNRNINDNKTEKVPSH